MLPQFRYYNNTFPEKETYDCLRPYPSEVAFIISRDKPSSHNGEHLIHAASQGTRLEMIDISLTDDIMAARSAKCKSVTVYRYASGFLATIQ